MSYNPADDSIRSQGVMTKDEIEEILWGKGRRNDLQTYGLQAYPQLGPGALWVVKEDQESERHRILATLEANKPSGGSSMFARAERAAWDKLVALITSESEAKPSHPGLAKVK